MKLGETQEMKLYCLHVNWGTLKHFEFLHLRFKSSHDLMQELDMS